MTDNLKWTKASYSGAQGGNCIEVAGHDSHVLVRDTKDRTGPTLRFTPDAWVRFAMQVKADASLASDSTDTYREGLSCLRVSPLFGLCRYMATRNRPQNGGSSEYPPGRDSAHGSESDALADCLSSQILRSCSTQIR